MESNLEKKEEQTTKKITIYEYTRPNHIIGGILLYFKERLPVLQKVDDYRHQGFYKYFEKIAHNKVYCYMNERPTIIEFGKKIKVYRAFPYDLRDFINSLSDSNDPRCCWQLLQKDIVMMTPNDSKIIIIYNIETKTIIHTEPFIEAKIHKISKINENICIIFGNDGKNLFIYSYDILLNSLSSKMIIDGNIPYHQISLKILVVNEEVILLVYEHYFYFINWKKQILCNVYNLKHRGVYPFVAVDTDLALFYEYPYEKVPTNQQKIKLLYLKNPIMLFDFAYKDIFHYIAQRDTSIKGISLFIYKTKYLFCFCPGRVLIFNKDNKESIYGTETEQSDTTSKVCGDYIIGSSMVGFEIYKINKKVLLALY